MTDFFRFTLISRMVRGVGTRQGPCTVSVEKSENSIPGLVSLTRVKSRFSADTLSTYLAAQFKGYRQKDTVCNKVPQQCSFSTLHSKSNHCHFSKKFIQQCQFWYEGRKGAREISEAGLLSSHEFMIMKSPGHICI